MAGVEKLINFALSLQAPLAVVKGFGIAGIMSFSPRQASWVTGELTRLYTDDLLGGDFAAGTPERLYAAALFAQEEAGRPEKVQICRGTVAPSQVVDVGVTTVLNSKRYDFMLRGLDSAGATVDRNVFDTSDASATNDEIIALLVAKVNSPAISGITAAATGSVGSQVCRITGVAGTWVAVSLEDSSSIITGPYNITNNLLNVSYAAANPATAIADQLDACVTERPDFYGLVNPWQGKDLNVAVANWVEGKERIAILDDASTAAATSVLAGATDLAAALKTAALVRTALLHHHKPTQAAAAAWMGSRLPTIPGTEDWFMAGLSTVTPTPLQTTHEANLDARNANYYGFIGADGNMSTGNTAGGYAIDYVRLRDKVKARCNEAIYLLHKSLAKQGKKVPGDDDGLLMARGAFKDALDQMVIEKALSGHTISMPRQVDRSTADKNVRKVSGIVIQAFATSSLRKYDPVTGVVTQ